MITSNSYEVNLLATKIANETYDFLDEKTKLGVNVPLGVFTGIRLISGYGKTIKMKLISTSSVKCEIRSEFTEAGINQTRHALYLDINCEVNIVTKTNSKRITDKISVLVYDNLIIGKVPSVFINSQIIGEGYKNI
jgi:sporulation protein YunB